MIQILVIKQNSNHIYKIIIYFQPKTIFKQDVNMEKNWKQIIIPALHVLWDNILMKINAINVITLLLAQEIIKFPF